MNVKMKVVAVTSVSTLQGPISVPAIVVMNLMKMELLAMVSYNSKIFTGVHV